MSSRGRAYRRWRYLCAKERIRRIVRDCWYNGRLLLIVNPDFPARAESTHLKPCSSPWCCGNPRRWRGKTYLTLAERRAAIDDRERDF